MAVAVDAVGPSSAGAGAVNLTGVGFSLTYSHTCGSTGSNGLLMVFAAWGNQVPSGYLTTLAATYNGVAMVPVGPRVYSGGIAADGGFSQWFGLLNPATGAHNVVITAAGTIAPNTGGDGNTIVGGSVSFTGYTPGALPRSVVSANDGGTFTGPATVAIGSATGDIVLDGLITGSGVGTSTQTSRWKDNFSTHSAAGCAASASAAGASSVTMQWSLSPDDIWAISAVNVTNNVVPNVNMAVQR